MELTSPLPLADRVSLVLGGLCRAVAARVADGAMAVALIVLVWRRVRRVELAMLGLLARFRAGRLRVRAGVWAGARALPGGGARVGVPGVPLRFGWLLEMMPFVAAGYAGQVRALLGDAEMSALLSASPQARRVLAPLCRMLGIEAAVPDGGGAQAASSVAVAAVDVAPAQMTPARVVVVAAAPGRIDWFGSG
jgi:hypothetical protein